MMEPLNEELADIGNQGPIPVEVVEVVHHSIVEGARTHVRGLAIGDRAPDFTLQSQDGEWLRLGEMLEDGPVVVCFLRGAWCPYCRTELRALMRVADEIRALGARLVCIHPQNEWNAEPPVVAPLALASDTLQNVMAGFHVRFAVTKELRRLYLEVFRLDLAATNANGQWNLPVPASFVVDRDGIVKARQFSHDFRVRVEPAYLLEALARLPERMPEFVAPNDVTRAL